VAAPRTPSSSPAPGSRSTAATRPVLTARELQALREALALRQAVAAGQPLTAAQVAAVRAGARKASSSGRQPARRTASGRPGPRRTPARKPAARASSRHTATPRTRSRWSTRLGVVALSTVLLPAVASLALPGTPDGGQGGGPLDVTALALTAQSKLLDQAAEYRRLELQVTARRTELNEARAAEQEALAQLSTEQQEVGLTAAGLYRAAPEARFPVFGARVDDAAATSDALFRHAVAERNDRALEGTLVRTERTEAAVETASRRVARAESAVDDATRAADEILDSLRAQVDELDTAVAGRLAGLGALPVAGAQQDRNQRATARWQDYLAQLVAADIKPPPAVALADPANLPRGLSPALDDAGQPIPGVAWAVIGSRPVTLLPAETVAAVSSALSQLGKPFVPGTTGPDTYDCGGFTSASWLLGGHAVPTTPQEQWATGAPVPLTSLQIGDLVFAPGGQDVGIYLGDGDVVGASAGSYQVGVRSLSAGSSATRVTLPAPTQPNAALPVGGDTGPCGAPLPVPGKVSPAWGGWSNGQIPAETLCALGVYRHALRCDAAASYSQMSTAYQAAFGTPLCITDSYRSLGSQIAAFYLKPGLAAVPGTSNHGWGLAVDLCGGVNIAGSMQWTWMTANAGRFGFVQPDWAAPGGEKPEPWHWEYGFIS
jgi:cell wall-associated NlpC family hydrolase